MQIHLNFRGPAALSSYAASVHAPQLLASGEASQPRLNLASVRLASFAVIVSPSQRVFLTHDRFNASRLVAICIALAPIPSRRCSRSARSEKGDLPRCRWRTVRYVLLLMRHALGRWS